MSSPSNHNMTSWGKPNKNWVKSREFEALPEIGCQMCFAFEKILSGSQATFILQLHSPEFDCGCQCHLGIMRLIYHDLLATCEAHMSLMEYILKLYDEFLERMMAARIYNCAIPAYGVELCRPRDGVPTITILDEECRGMKVYEFIIRKPPNAGVSSEETTIDTSWIDLNVAAMWKTSCAHHHGAKCRERDNAALVTPDWLIDTKENRIVRGEASMQFVALSYRWGTSVWSRVGLDKLDELRKPDGLSNSFIVKLPIIRDAIHVVRSIGERYLWADAVCIIRDDKDHVAHQLQHMGAIYASAKLAIMATDGDGMTGLPGLRGCSAPRNLGGVFPWTNNREVFVRDLPSLSYIHTPEYFKRGWTFQEYTLSPRRLIFGKKQIHWTCAGGSWHEDLPYTPSPTNENNELVLQSTIILRRRPDFNALGNLIRMYNNQEMTYPEDALPGIAGLLGLISPSFQGGFLFGLPIMCFEAALMWGSKFWYCNSMGIKYKGLERRQRSDKTHSLLPDAELPSWSWIGWKSDYLSLLEHEEDYRVVTYPHHPRGSFSRSEKWITIPTTQWFCHDTPTSTSKHHIQPSWFKLHRENPQPRNLPKGWVRGKYLGANGLNAANFRSIPFGIGGDYVYHHPELPDRLFWRPFPVSADGQSAAPSQQMTQGKFLSCKTKRGRFRCVRKTGSSMEAGSMDYHLQLLDKRHQVCGWIQLPHASAALPSLHREAGAVSPDGDIKMEDAETPSGIRPIPTNGSPGGDELVELVVICKRYFSESVNYSRCQWHNRRAYRQFYGVLCIEWDRGVAYRKGCGYVFKKVWDQHDVEDVDLVLG